MSMHTGWARLRATPDWKLAAVLATLGFAPVLPSLGTGLAALDHLVERSDPARVDQARMRWDWPWWAAPTVQVRCLRPVAAAMAYFDYGLFEGH